MYNPIVNLEPGELSPASLKVISVSPILTLSRI
jgi:hypothetical protein